MKLACLLKTLAVAAIVSIATGVFPGGKAAAETLSPITVNSPVQDTGQSTGEVTSLSGKWLLVWQGRKKAGQVTLNIQQKGSKLTGTFAEGDRSGPLSGSLQAGQVSISVRGKKRSMIFSGTVEGGQMSGTASDGSSWTATRQ